MRPEHLAVAVIVSRMDSEHSVSRTVCFLNRGESFGELGLISNAPRQASVISKEPVELLVFSDEVTSRTRVPCVCVLTSRALVITLVLVYLYICFTKCRAV